jgi:hypothetical protein
MSTFDIQSGIRRILSTIRERDKFGVYIITLQIPKQLASEQLGCFCKANAEVPYRRRPA